MPTYYFHPTRGNNSNDGLTEATAFATINPYYGAPDVVYALAAGQTHVFAGYKTFSSGTASKPMTVRAYQDSRDTNPGRLAKIICSNPLSGILFITAQAEWQVYEDLWFLGDTGTTLALIYAAAQGTTNHTRNQVFRRCKFENPAGMGFYAAFEDDSTVELSGITHEDCEYVGCSWHGIYLQGTDHKIIRPRAIGNGYNHAPGGAHGISLQAKISNIALSGMSNPSGNIRAFSLTSAQANAAWAAPYALRLSGVTGDVNADALYTRNDAAGSTPAPGEFSRVGSTVYFNPGTSATNGVAVVAMRPASNILVWRPLLEGNYDLQANDWAEPAFAFDDLSSNNRLIGGVIRNNIGPGVSINRGAGNVIQDCLIYGNGGAAIAALGPNSTVLNCTSFGNNNGTLTGGHAPTGFEYVWRGTGGVIQNCVMKANPGKSTKGVESTVSIAVDCLTAHGFTSHDQTGTNYSTADPLLMADGTPRAGSPVLATGKRTTSRLDVHGRPRGIRPSRGAVEPRRNVPVLPA